MTKHNLDYKRVDNKFAVVCKDCGQFYGSYNTEGEARMAIMQNTWTPLQAKLNRIFPKRRF